MEHSDITKDTFATFRRLTLLEREDKRDEFFRHSRSAPTPAKSAYWHKRALQLSNRGSALVGLA